MGGLQVARRQGRLVLVATLCLSASWSLSAQPASAPSAPDAAQVAQAAASAASAVAAAKAAAGASIAADAAAAKVAKEAASAPTGECPSPGAAYCQTIPAGWLVLVLGLYACAFAAVRWYLVARPNLHNLEGQVGAMRQWVAAHPKPATVAGADNDQIEALLKRIEELAAPDKHTFMDKLLWSRGKDLSGWHLLYQAWELLLPRQSPESLRCQLEEAALVPASADPASVDLAQRIKAELQREPLDPRDAGQTVLQELRAYLARFDSELDGDIDRMIGARGSAAAPTAPAALGMVKRVGVALRPPATLTQRLAAAEGLLPLWQLLVEHARDVVLPDASSRQQLLDALAGAAAAPTVDACLDALAQSRDERRALQSLTARLRTALDAAPLAPSERRFALAKEALVLQHVNY